MATTKQITFDCTDVSISHKAYSNTITVESPDVREILGSISDEEIQEFVREEYEVDEVFTDEQLEKWAEANGYIKEQ